MVAAYVPSELDKYITLPQLAAKLGLGTTGGLRTSIIRGDLKAIKFGTQWVVHEDEAERFAREHSNRPGRRPKPRTDDPNAE